LVEITDWIVSFLKDWSLVIAVVILAIATFHLAKQTRATAQQSKATAELTKASIMAAEALQTMPALTFNDVQPLSDGEGKYWRFSVKNIGYGHAKNPTVKVTNNDGRQLPTKPWTKTTMIEIDGLFYWDVYDAKVGDELTIEISFTDIRGVPYESFKHSFTIT
jgi:hypothetical protein